MDPDIRAFAQAMVDAAGLTTLNLRTRMARIKKVNKGLATLTDGLVVAVQGKDSDFPPGTRVLVLGTPKGNPRIVRT